MTVMSGRCVGGGGSAAPRRVVDAAALIADDECAVEVGGRAVGQHDRMSRGAEQVTAENAASEPVNASVNTRDRSAVIGSRARCREKRQTRRRRPRAQRAVS